MSMKNRVRIGFFGSPELAAACLLRLLNDFQVVLVVTQPDREVGRGRKLRETPVSGVAKTAHIRILKPLTIDHGILYVCEEQEVNLIVVVAFGMILPEYLIHFPQYGALNLHASLLPKYRGASPIESSLLEGNRITGMTVQIMERRMDAGDIIAHMQVPITPEVTAEDLMDIFILQGPGFLTLSIDDYLSGREKPKKQDDREATYCSKISKEDGRINWHEDAGTVVNKIRAFNLWPVAFTSLEGKLLRVFRAHLSEFKDEEEHEPGRIVKLDRSEGIVVQTGNGLIGITDLQLENKRRMNHEVFINGYRSLLGKILG